MGAAGVFGKEKKKWLAPQTLPADFVLVKQAGLLAGAGRVRGREPAPTKNEEQIIPKATTDQNTLTGMQPSSAAATN
jgi:hypothetical protein